MRTGSMGQGILYFSYFSYSSFLLTSVRITRWKVKLNWKTVFIARPGGLVWSVVLHIKRLQVPSLVKMPKGVNWSMFLAHINISLLSFSLFLSPPLTPFFSLSICLGEDLKKERKIIYMNCWSCILKIKVLCLN